MTLCDKYFFETFVPKKSQMSIKVMSLCSIMIDGICCLFADSGRKCWTGAGVWKEI